jgi:hypothetical protein
VAGGLSMGGLFAQTQDSLGYGSPGARSMAQITIAAPTRDAPRNNASRLMGWLMPSIGTLRWWPAK